MFPRGDFMRVVPTQHSPSPSHRIMHAKFFEPDRTDAWTEEEQEPTVHHIDHQQALLIMMSFET